MFVDHRTHDLKLAPSESFSRSTKKKGSLHGRSIAPVGFLALEVGNMNGIVHTWTRKISLIAPDSCCQCGLSRLICRRAENM